MIRLRLHSADELSGHPPGYRTGRDGGSQATAVMVCDF